MHDPEFFSEEAAEAALKCAVRAGVTKIVCIATSLADSKRAIAFAHRYPQYCWASIGIHPHEAAQLSAAEIERQVQELADLAQDKKVVAVGECGLDFYYNEKAQYLTLQERLLVGQLEVASHNKLPVSFHVREAFDDFWRIMHNYPHISGVLHSFTDTQLHLNRALERGFMVGINGIATFTTHQWQREVFKNIPLENIVVETDTPFLTPVPKRGTINTPENVIYITKFLAELRDEEEKIIANATTANAEKLFNI